MSSLFTFNPSPSPPSSPWNSALASPNPGASRTTTPLSGHGSKGDGKGEQQQQQQPPHNVVSLAPGISSLESEPQVGPVEYKLSIVNPTPARLQHLTTQMLWRMQQSCESHNTAAAPPPPPLSAFGESNESGSLNGDANGVDKSYYAALLQDTQGCFYEIGVADDGRLVGLPEWELEQSLKSLNKMAGALGCKADVVRRITVGKKVDDEGNDVPLLVAEAHITPAQFQKRGGSPLAGPALSDNDNPVVASHTVAVTPPQLRVALFGPTGAGKSTLIGTLTTEKLDNGLGAVRHSIFKHLHELQSGVTSSIASELLGFNRAGEVVNYCSGNVSSWMDIHAAVAASSASSSSTTTTSSLANLDNETSTTNTAAADQSRTVLLMDSAGRFRYRRTAIRVLMGWAPHYACVLLPSNTLSAGSATSTAAFNYLTLCLKLEIPTLVIITKLDAGEKSAFLSLYKTLFATIRSFGKQPKRVDEANPKAAAAFFENHRDEVMVGSVVPVLIVSALNGKGIPSLLASLRTLPIPDPPPLRSNQIEDTGSAPLLLETPGLQTLFHIEEKFECSTPGADFVISGHVRYGHVTIGDELLIGPFPRASCWSTPTSSFNEPTSKWGGRSITPSSEDGHGRKLMRRNSHVSSASNSDDDDGTVGEWKVVRVVSVRKCRAPVGVLNAGEAGTVGVAWERDSTGTDGAVDEVTARTASMTLLVPSASASPAQPIHKSVSFAGNIPERTSSPAPISTSAVRKGLVLLNRHPKGDAIPSSPAVVISKGHHHHHHQNQQQFWPKIATGFAAEFNPAETEGLGVGADVIVYFASVRAKGKVVRIEVIDPCIPAHDNHGNGHDTSGDSGGLFGFDNEDNNDHTTDAAEKKKIRYWFRFSQSLEWVERGVTVLVTDFRVRHEDNMASGLGEAMVGKIVDVEEL